MIPRESGERRGRIHPAGTMMKAAEALEKRKEELRRSLVQAQDPAQAAAALEMTLERVAADLAREDQEDTLRQKRQAVLALAKRAPYLLRASDAKAELVVEEQKEAPVQKARKAALYAGAVILMAIAGFELLNNRITLAALQLLGGVLLILGVRSLVPQSGEVRARGIPAGNVEKLLRETEELCRAIDACSDDLEMIERENVARMNGTADDALLDLLGAMMEARASNEPEIALRSLDQAGTYLRMMGMESQEYDGENGALFDLLPSLGESRTLRHAILQDGKVVRRGVATLSTGGEKR